MKKIIFILLSSLFTGIFSCSELLSASSPVLIQDLDQSSIVKTTIPVTDSTSITPAYVYSNQSTLLETILSTSSLQTTESHLYTSAPIITTVPAYNIQFGNHTLEIRNVDSTTVNSGNHVNKIGKLLYGHNSATVFGDLQTLSLGETFTVTENNLVTTYQITAITLYEKNPDGRLQLNGSGNYMKAIRDKALGHDIALMTCAGTSYGNQDASHRLVIFADTI